jgi:hypothetical protein
MTEEITKDITYRFEDVDDTTVVVTVLDLYTPWQATMTGVTWGMMEEIMNIQERSKESITPIFDFLNNHIEGGTAAVPIKHTMSLFQAIAEYMNQVMSTQKN